MLVQVECVRAPAARSGSVQWRVLSLLVWVILSLRHWGTQFVVLTMTGKVEKLGQIPHLTGAVPRVGQLGVRVAQLVEEGVDHGVDGRLSLGGRVLEQPRNEVDGVAVGLAEDLVEGVRLDLREFVLHVIRVHSANLLSSGRSQDLDDLDELVDA